MPIYQCLSAAGVVTDELKPRIAKEITRLHCEATKAPHVEFTPEPGPPCKTTAGFPSARPQTSQ